MIKIILQVSLALIFVCVELQATELNASLDPIVSVSLDAKFSTTKCEIPCLKPVRLDWWMMRRSGQVEIRNLQASSEKPISNGEIWRFSPQGKMSHLYLMHDDKRAIEYLFDDLKILGVPSTISQWQFISQLVTEEELACLNKNSQVSADFQGHKTVLYTGKIKEVLSEILWIPDLRVPVKITYHYPKNDVTVALDKVFEGDQLKLSDAPMTNEQELQRYQQVSFVDIGDMEQDPEVQAWVARAHGALGLSRNAHHHH